jgi:uncharacterized protein (DUF305 family)
VEVCVLKKTTLVFLSLALAVLLGLAVYVAFLALGSGALQTCPIVPNAQRNLQFAPRGRMGPGMMGPGGTMGPMGAFVNSEYDFLVHMIPHHEEAIFTANILKKNTEREEMKKFADDIIRIQSQEIEQMTTWLAIWYPEKDHNIDYHPMMRPLENLKGEELDQAFLEDMIPHHMEAVMMSQQLISRGLAEHEEVALLAINIRNNQRDEIHMMMNWMSRWYGNAPIAETNYGITLIWVGLIALAVLIVLAVWLISVVSSGSVLKVSSVKSAKELLDIRYAKGEISQEEYRNTRKNLER